MDEILQNFAQKVLDRIEALLFPRLKAFFDKFFRSEIKVVFSETEAAAFLSVKKETLQAWRGRKLIEYSRLPVGRLRDGEEDRLGDTYTYTIAALLSFQERYAIKTLEANRFEINPVLSLVGPEIADKREFKKVA